MRDERVRALGISESSWVEISHPEIESYSLSRLNEVKAKKPVEAFAKYVNSILRHNLGDHTMSALAKLSKVRVKSLDSICINIFMHVAPKVQRKSKMSLTVGFDSDI